MLLGESMIFQMEKAIEREFQPHLLLFKELAPYYISNFDKELAFNQDQIRNFIRKMIEDRRNEIKENPKLGDRGDLLSIMIQDPLFENNDD